MLWTNDVLLERRIVCLPIGLDTDYSGRVVVKDLSCEIPAHKDHTKWVGRESAPAFHFCLCDHAMG